MAKPKPGGRRPRKRERKNTSLLVCATSSVRSTTPSSASPTSRAMSCPGPRAVVSDSRFAQEHTLRRAARRREGCQGCLRAGMRRVEVHAKGPARVVTQPFVRCRTPVSRSPAQGRDPGAAQRLQDAQAEEELSHGSLHRPKVRLSRRLGINVFENAKGSKALERRPFPPGQHGRTVVVATRAST